MKTAHIEAIISPEVGAKVAGYGANDFSVMKYDDLTLQGVCFDNGETRALLISYDLIGMDHVLVAEIRQKCAAILGIPESAVLLSCTHTHGGPHTRYGSGKQIDTEACRLVVDQTVKAVSALKPEDFTEGQLYFYSGHAKANMNRRYCGPDNVCHFLPEERELEPLADGFVDDEVGILFQQGAGRRLTEIIVNYAAHPLASHTPGASGHAITSDFVGLLRKYINETTHAHTTFVNGAAGDQFPIDSEIGFQNLDTIAKPVAREAIRGVVNAPRGNGHNGHFQVADTIQSMIRTVPVHFKSNRERPLYYTLDKTEKDTYDLEFQLLAIGDVCFVGVPCELLAELGAEIKWHSPYRKTFICYNSTDYVSYICHANALLSGGYEATMQNFEPLCGLKLVQAVVEAMFELHGNR